jgi:hypothetical protein
MRNEGQSVRDDAEKHIFYQAVVRICDGAMLLSKRYAESCRKRPKRLRAAGRRSC